MATLEPVAPQYATREIDFQTTVTVVSVLSNVSIILVTCQFVDTTLS